MILSNLVPFGAFLLASVCIAENFADYYCPEKSLQQHIDIGQLLGMWFVTEKVIHHDDLRYIKNLSTCPIIYISEDPSRSTTYNPMIKNYDLSYGGEYGYNTGYNNRENQRRTDPYDPYSSNDNNNNNYDRGGQEYYNTPSPPYNRQYTQPPYKNRQYNPRRYGTAAGHDEYIRHLHSMRYLTLRWDGNGDSAEYNLKYNISRPGLWISSGPDDGTHLKTEFQHFAGTIQVLKAVGNHVVLTFCHPHPTKQLFTVLLSREASLKPADRHSVHNMLANRGLTTTAVQKMCSSGLRFSVNEALVAILSVVCLLRMRN